MKIDRHAKFSSQGNILELKSEIGAGHDRARVIAFLGKGGVGKTACSAMTARILAGKAGIKTLLIDADPAMGLVFALGLGSPRTIGEVRDEVIRGARSAQSDSDKERLSMSIDYLVMESLLELPDYAVMVMGRAEGPGCFCPVNSLLRAAIEELSQGFDYIVIDAEAGIEQVTRQVTRRVDCPIIVTDASLRGAEAALAIGDALRSVCSIEPLGVLFNKPSSSLEAARNRLERAGTSILGTLPQDEMVARFDAEGRPLTELPMESPALAALEKALSSAGVIVK